jgi:hypothetical protein
MKTASSATSPFGKTFFPAQQLLNFFPLPHGHVSFLPTRIQPPALAHRRRGKRRRRQPPTAADDFGGSAGQRARVMMRIT